MARGILVLRASPELDPPPVSWPARCPKRRAGRFSPGFDT